MRSSSPEHFRRFPQELLAGKMQAAFNDPYSIPLASTSAERQQVDFRLGATTPAAGGEKSQLEGGIEGEEKRKKKRPRQVLSCELILRLFGESEEV